jgi:hypothetical protein
MLSERVFTDEHTIAPSPEPGRNVRGAESKPKSPSPTVAANKFSYTHALAVKYCLWWIQARGFHWWAKATTLITTPTIQGY